MANGLAIKDVDNKLQSLTDSDVIPVSSGANEPEVVEVGVLKSHMDIPDSLAELSEDSTHRVVTDTEKSAWNGKQDAIADLSTIRSGAALGATAVQTEVDPTVPSWAKEPTKPTYTAEEVGALPDDTSLFSGNYNDLTNKPTLFSGDYDDLTNKPNIPDALSELSEDSTHRTVTDTEKTAWNGKSDFSGSYNDLTDKPTIPTIPTLATVATSGSYNDLSDKPTIPEAQVQSDWSESDTTSKAYIQNKPTIPVGIPSGGNASQILKKASGTDYDVAWGDQTQIYPSGYCVSGGSRNPKVVNLSSWTATANTYFTVVMGAANTVQGAITMTVNGNPLLGAPVYINGEASSATNYTLPAGSYIVFYDGTNFYFRTDGTIPSVGGATLEDAANKVTSISSSSTDTQYPSALATYTYINTMLGDIETLLSAI